MQGFANGRGLAALLNKGSAAPSAGSGPATVSEPWVGYRRLGAVKAMLDGIGGLGWSVIGFVGGAVFWHFVGFWGFVSDVVLAGGPPAVVERSVLAGAGRAHWVQVAATDPACTLLSRDRSTGVVASQPCNGDLAPLPADSFEGRQDRMDWAGPAEDVPLNADGSVGP